MREVFTEAIFQIIAGHLQNGIGFNILCETNKLVCDNENILISLKERFPDKVTFAINDECLLPENYEWEKDSEGETFIIKLPFDREIVEFYFKGFEIFAVVGLNGAPLVVRPQPVKPTQEQLDSAQKVNNVEKKREEFLAHIKQQLGDRPIQKMVNMSEEEKEGMSRSMAAFVRNNPELKIKGK